MATRQPQTTEPTLEAYRDPETIAATLSEPWENPTVLEQLYHDRGYSVEQIARDVFDGDVCPETVRKRMAAHDIPRGEPTLADRLAESDPEDLGLSPSTGEGEHERFTKRGRSA